MSQKVLVAGTGISGIAAAKLLLAQGGEVVLYDGNDKLSVEGLKEKFDEDAKLTVILGELRKLDLVGVELAIFFHRLIKSSRHGEAKAEHALCSGQNHIRIALLIGLVPNLTDTDYRRAKFLGFILYVFCIYHI